jgi:hypothetical protein
MTNNRRHAELRGADSSGRPLIVAYVRALQLSQNATPADVPADAQAKLDQPVEEQLRGAAASHGGGHE